MIGPATIELEAYLPTIKACELVGRSRATHYRRRQPPPDPNVVAERRRATMMMVSGTDGETID